MTWNCAGIVFLICVVVLLFALRRSPPQKTSGPHEDSQAGVVVAASPDGLARFDHNLVCTFASPTVASLFDGLPAGVPGCSLAQLAGDDAAAVTRAAEEARTNAQVGEAVIRLPGEGESCRWIEVRCAPLAGTSDLVASFRDITLRRSAELALRVANSELSRLAGTDARTGLANRRRFEQTLQIECRRASRRAMPLSVVLLAAEGLAGIATRHGQAAADLYLNELAAALARVAPSPTGLAARLGIAEFALLLPEVDAAAAAAVTAILRDATTALAGPQGGDGAADAVSVSLGCATCWPTPDTLASADAALLSEADRCLQARHAATTIGAGAGPVAGGGAITVRPSAGMHQIARIAAMLLQLPTSFVLRAGPDGAAVLGHHGWGGLSMVQWCRETPSQGETLVVLDTGADPAFRHVRSESGFAFLAAAPMRRGPGRQPVGTLWVADRAPRASWTEAEALLLAQLAGLAAETLEDPPAKAACDVA